MLVGLVPRAKVGGISAKSIVGGIDVWDRWWDWCIEHCLEMVEGKEQSKVWEAVGKILRQKYK